MEEPTIVRARAYIGHYAVIGEGTVVEDSVVVDDYSSVESWVSLGDRSLVLYRAHICNEARIGKGCVIGGLIGERVVVGNGARVFGKVIHSQHNPSLDWDAPLSEEPSATLEENVFVGFDALVIGGVVVARNAYVCAGAVVTRNVPAGHVVYGVNKIVPRTEWKGPLSSSPHFER